MNNLTGRMYTTKKRINIMISLVLSGDINAIKFYEWLIMFANEQINKLKQEDKL